MPKVALTEIDRPTAAVSRAMTKASRTRRLGRDSHAKRQYFLRAEGRRFGEFHRWSQCSRDSVGTELDRRKRCRKRVIAPCKGHSVAKVWTAQNGKSIHAVGRDMDRCADAI